jgi:hypothetical protein
MVAMWAPLVLCGRSILLGWAVLVGLIYLVERPLLILTAPIFGRHWVGTESVLLNCLMLAAAGWCIVRWHRSVWKLGLLAFALTLTLWDFGPEVALNVPWLIRLTSDAIRDSTYLASLVATATTHLLLFGSLAAGGLWSRPVEAPVSILAVTNATGPACDE